MLMNSIKMLMSAMEPTPVCRRVATQMVALCVGAIMAIDCRVMAHLVKVYDYNVKYNGSICY